MDENQYQYCPQCQQELSPVGNFSYGPSRFTEVSRNILHIAIPAITIFVTMILGLLSYVIYLTVPLILCYIIICKLPKTTKIHCHHCGYKKEMLGNHVIEAPVSKKSLVAPIAIKKAAVVDQSKSLTAHKKAES